MVPYLSTYKQGGNNCSLHCFQSTPQGNYSGTTPGTPSSPNLDASKTRMRQKKQTHILPAELVLAKRIVALQLLLYRLELGPGVSLEKNANHAREGIEAPLPEIVKRSADEASGRVPIRHQRV